MINGIQLIRNIGQFDSVDTGANIPFGRLTLIFAENGRGKTTLSAVFRSLASGDSVPITERRRLGAQNPPHVVLACAGGPQPAIFQNDAWTRTMPDLAVFDDAFVDANVYSGLVVGPEHRQSLHELILGAQGVTLNKQLQRLVDQVETHNGALRTKGNAIPTGERGALSVDDFCALPREDNIEEKIRAAERGLAAVRQHAPIRDTPILELLRLPAFDLEAIGLTLQTDLPSLDAAAAARVQEHLRCLNPEAEAWIADGMSRLAAPDVGDVAAACPFCAQDLGGSPVFGCYRSFFGDAYRELKHSVSSAIAGLSRVHGGDAAATFERAVRVLGERRQFWSGFCEVPEIPIDTEAVVRAWRGAAEALLVVLKAKEAAPLDRIALPDTARAPVLAYDAHRQAAAILNRNLELANAAIRLVKEQASGGNQIELAASVARLKAVRERQTPVTSALCGAFLAEKAAKAATEHIRDQTKAQLDQFRANAFPGYQAAVNAYLERFNAEFRLDRVTPSNTRQGPTCTYNVVINNSPVPVAGGVSPPNQPSFRNTLSAGDRSALALAFFFASLDPNPEMPAEPELAAKIVVIDDPVSSLDDHRSLTTVQVLRRLAQRTAQVIVLSHTKPFLCCLWEGAVGSARSALHVAREGAGSTLRVWDVNRDCVTEHDRRHAVLRSFLVTSTADDREIASAIRPTLEAFCRIAYPEHFQPGTLLGPFLGLCDQRLQSTQAVLSATDILELRELVEYANRFHHETNPAWKTEVINDTQLRGYVERALRFATRPAS